MSNSVIHLASLTFKHYSRGDTEAVSLPRKRQKTDALGVSSVEKHARSNPRPKKQRCTLVDGAHAPPSTHRSRDAFGDKLPPILLRHDAFEFELPDSLLPAGDLGESELSELTNSDGGGTMDVRV
ncbi:hypothetical protein FB451DRAFT_1396915 [Mycena latifolia]|nr:hypothetical protein FB451DRAFT_1396915 [Mycena latifolia]